VTLRDRRLFKEEALGNHGQCQGPRKRRNRVASHPDPPQPPNHGVAAQFGRFRQPGLRLSGLAPRPVCGRLFLARLPSPRGQARHQSRLLAAQTFEEHRKRPPCELRAAKGWLVGSQNLAAFAHWARLGRRENCALARGKEDIIALISSDVTNQASCEVSPVKVCAWPRPRQA